MIDVDHLTLVRGERTVLRDYSLHVERGSVLAILGANGIGKTTLLSALVGLLKPNAGTVAVAGKVGFVPQLFQAAFAYSVLDIVLMGRARQIGLFRSPSAHDFEVARSYLALMGVSALEARGFNTLSGGQRQLVMIAQALASECNVLILDEPCSALDYKNQATVISTLRTLNREHGQTIVFTTHAPQHGLEVADRVLLMKDSDSYSYGPTAEVLTPDKLTDLYGVAIDRADFAGTGGFTLAPRFVAQG
jgi:iron complex transport system ATP-binding protein